MEDAGGRQANHPNRLRQRLAEPVDSTTADDLLSRWFQADIIVRVGLGPPPGLIPGLITDPRLPGRLRGALGEALLAGASAEARRGEPCPWDPPCALDVLWGETGPVRRGVEIPRPFVVRVDPDPPDDARITLSLFGFATDWAEGVAEALVRALRAGVGSGVDGARLTLEPGRRDIVTPEPPTPVMPEVLGPGLGSVALDVRTPLVLRRKSALVLDPLALLTSLSRRAEGFARWHDTALTVDGGALAETAAALTLDGQELRPAGWTRGSARQPGRGIPVTGVVGRLVLRGPPEALARAGALLALGGRFGAGGHAAQGMGRYDIERGA
ncbi:CRISPR system precrRNA processing endoribonuclease RAMP protein Cas6 [Roseospira marina]|uniref:CRISPR system precrRNA processing endoribonuclease RAMP protein Cas6 n=1 Tax=Roseospira marina TaxID=140057 RepID=A0A5M6I7R8_9PROT|nr:CRISPR system precrRNA processing endoribonuclease RAMP protein Cas6 [Roseospira marina]KAA5603779.1 CRISPR system precrRNA processing endoribonuclease RAMP protein Cas6 [Roseospira marina]MBB4316096.1 hypothetical protein [Roseospira marina]MBB5089262.1 hypothetical protein [Roseospira marina]